MSIRSKRCRPVSSADPQWCATGGELAEQHMQPASGLGAQPGQVVVTVGEEPQHGGVIIAIDASQAAMTQPGDRCREGIIGVVGRLDRPKRTLAASVGGTSTTRSPAATSC